MADNRVGSAETLLRNGEMKRLELEGKPVVITRVEGNYYAFGGNCPHYGAPLNEGVLRGSTLMCPWHHACFDVRTAARLEPPSLNDLARFPVRIDGGELVVTLPNDNERQPQGTVDPADGRHFVIIGGGAVGNSAAEELRRSGYHGRITILSSVDTPPVDRPNLSKDFLAGEAQPDWIPLRDAGWYAKRDIDLRLNTTVASVDPAAHEVTLEGGEIVPYDKLLVATGGIPRDLKRVPGGDAEGIYTLRSLADSDRILQAAKTQKRVVIIGASFIGLEAASSLAHGSQAQVTIVDMVTVPFERVLGDRIGKAFMSEHTRNGVTFRLNTMIAGFTEENGHVSGVRLGSGEVITADFVLAGVGVRPATDFLASSGVTLNDKDKSVEVSAQLQSSSPDIFAAGDIARYPTREGESQRIEHWRTAQQHGVVAARNMLGVGVRDSVNSHVPFFWTTQWDFTLRYVGHAEAWDEIIYRGSPEDKNFIAFYVKGGELKAAAGAQHDQAMDAIEFILLDGKPLTTEQMHNQSFDLVAYATS
jgi:NADPH-dependent 2,4-dienoyl-CoA reductase/sulfur reductase-like enzyme/nitrite reductase/ring-hydroxylating ferredoxin subunit